MIDEAINLVREFHILAEQPVAEYPRFLESERVRIRAKWIVQEIDELCEAKNVYQQADAAMDILYYLLGVFVEMGISADKLFYIIHEANLRKLIMADCIIKDDELKVQKPNNWKHPDELVKKAVDQMIDEKI